MSRPLPARANLEQLRKQAKALLKGHQSASPAALARIREHHPRYRGLPDTAVASARFTLADAQLVLAHEYGFQSWAKLKAEVALRRPDTSLAEHVAGLRDAAGRGDLARLNALLDAHPEIIDEPGGQGVRTALHQAVFGKSEAAVRLLLERGANPNVRCEGDNAYPLHFAVEKNLVPIIHLLVEHGSDTVGEGDYHELGVIGWASAWDHIPADPATIEYLLAHGAKHTIFSAVAMGDAEAIRELVRRTPADLEKRMNGTIMHRMPLHLAVVKKQPASLATLLELGANTESLDEAGLTPLDLAALIGQTEMASVLIDRGAKIRLPAAIALHRTRDVERLLARDPGTLKAGGRWRNLIVRAAERSTGEIVEALIAAGAEVNIPCDPGTAIDRTSRYTALHGAAWFGNMGAIEVLMRHGADVTVREERYHGTPAGWADYSGHTEARDRILLGPVDLIEAVQFRLAERVGAILDSDPEAVNRPFAKYGLFPMDAESWFTPLVYAAQRGYAEIVRLLLDRGADRTVCSPSGETLREIAAKANHSEVVELLPGG
ncbi:MAG TPA: ankyrin repeat domain-containing protein [Terracidiphilus sp.]|nr:ankyrin repeat domain-containing protein [Terracidiphilus sp.]